MATESGLVRPDITVYLDAPVADTSLRPGFGNDRFETRDIQTRASLAYNNMIHQQGWIVIDASSSMDEVRDQCTVHVFSKIEDNPGPLEYI